MNLLEDDFTDTKLEVNGKLGTRVRQTRILLQSWENMTSKNIELPKKMDMYVLYRTSCHELAIDRVSYIFPN